MLTCAKFKQLFFGAVGTDRLHLATGFLLKHYEQTRIYDDAVNEFDCTTRLAELLWDEDAYTQQYLDDDTISTDEEGCALFAILFGGSGIVYRKGVALANLHNLENSNCPFVLLLHLIAEARLEDCEGFALWTRFTGVDNQFSQFMCQKRTVEEARAMLLVSETANKYDYAFCCDRLIAAENRIKVGRCRVALAYWRNGYRPQLYNQLFGLAPLNLPVLLSVMILNYVAPWLIAEDWLPMDRKWQCIKVVNDAWMKKYATK